MTPPRRNLWSPPLLLSRYPTEGALATRLYVQFQDKAVEVGELQTSATSFHRVEPAWLPNMVAASLQVCDLIAHFFEPTMATFLTIMTRSTSRSVPVIFWRTAQDRS